MNKTLPSTFPFYDKLIINGFQPFDFNVSKVDISSKQDGYDVKAYYKCSFCQKLHIGKFVFHLLKHNKLISAPEVDRLFAISLSMDELLNGQCACSA
jgi:hypothetical protein